MSCPPGTTCKSWGLEAIRGSAITESSGRRPLILCLGVLGGLAVAEHSQPPGGPEALASDPCKRYCSPILCFGNPWGDGGLRGLGAG
jgi:hypothetical protein